MHGIIGKTRDASLTPALPALNAAEINREAALADGLYRESVAHALRCGQMLIADKAALKAKFGHGHWEEWCRQHLTIADRTVRLFMQLAALPAEKRQRVAEMPLRQALSAVRHLDRTLQSVEYYTPANIIAAARRVLGGIDLDPASNNEANLTVGATRFYTAQQNGLALPWHGKTWLNPPYWGQAGDFVKKLLDEYRAGNVSAAIALLNSRSIDSAWFRPLWSELLCFTYKRVEFNGERHPYAPSVLAYLGRDEQLFADQFARFGAVMRRWTSPVIGATGLVGQEEQK